MPDSDSDVLSLFLIERSGVRGVLVHLDETWQSILARAPYPPAVAACLGETCAAAALFTGHAKLDGRLSVQLRGTGALRTLFAECTAEGTLRGIAHYAEPLPEPLTPRAFGDGSVMAITIENLPPGGQEMLRYRAWSASMPTRWRSPSTTTSPSPSSCRPACCWPPMATAPPP